MVALFLLSRVLTFGLPAATSPHATTPTVEIAPGVMYPIVQLGTCCGSWLRIRPERGTGGLGEHSEGRRSRRHRHGVGVQRPARHRNGPEKTRYGPERRRSAQEAVIHHQDPARNILHCEGPDGLGPRPRSAEPAAAEHELRRPHPRACPMRPHWQTLAGGRARLEGYDGSC